METETKTSIEIIRCKTCRLRRFAHEFRVNRLGERLKTCAICRSRGVQNRERVKAKKLAELKIEELKIEELKIEETKIEEDKTD